MRCELGCAVEYKDGKSGFHPPLKDFCPVQRMDGRPEGPLRRLKWMFGLNVPRTFPQSEPMLRLHGMGGGKQGGKGKGTVPSILLCWGTMVRIIKYGRLSKQTF